jgi:hypothetical protein
MAENLEKRAATGYYSPLMSTAFIEAWRSFDTRLRV